MSRETGAPRPSRQQPRIERLRWRKDDPEHNLLKATQDFVLARKGGVIVIGGIEIQQWGESPNHYRVAVACLGKPPIKEKP